MKLDFSPTQIFAILIVLFMLGSSIAIAFLSGGNINPPDDNLPDTPLNPGNQPPITYSAQVDASVVQILPQAILVGATTQTTIGALDSAILGIRGVYLQPFNSYYRQDPQTNELLYFAEFSFDTQQTDAQQILASTQSLGIFSRTPEVYSYALVWLPNRMSLRNASLDLNREYLFLEPLVEAFVGSQTRAEDTILVQVDATFTGNSLTQLVVSELENESVAFTQRRASRLYLIDELLPQLFFSTDVNYNSRFESAALTTQLQVLSDVNTAQVLLQPVAPFTIQFFFQDTQSRADANELLSGHADVNSVTIVDAPYGFDAQLVLSDRTQVERIRTELRQLFVSNDWTENESFVFAPFTFRLAAQIETTTTELAALKNRILQLLDVADVTIYQWAYTNVSEIEGSLTDPTQPNYQLPSDQLRIGVFAGNSVGQPVVILLDYVTSRNDVVQILSALQIEGEQAVPGNPDENPFGQ